MNKETIDEYPHLNSETKRTIKKGRKAKIDWIMDEHFVEYPQAMKIIRELSIIIRQPQRPNMDLRSISIVGDSGTGKTAIIKYFKELNQKIIKQKEHSTYKIAHATLSDAELGLKGLFLEILLAEPFQYPIQKKRLGKFSTIQLQHACIDLLKETEVRLLFADEIQHALGRNEQTTINSLKRVVQASGVPLVPVGTRGALEILTKDKQLASRCRIKPFSVLTPWQYSKEFMSFLGGYEKFLPFPKPSSLKSTKTSKKIFDITYKMNYNPLLQIASNQNDKGKMKSVDLRSLVQVIKDIAVYTIMHEEDCITNELIEKYEKENL
ncbi:MAG: TniB family NTP-binding protein [Candidatus Heimdallarchaeota archaeon]|nr:TniB family NTP-binding protein [Candidatus Heimdallarchaeota archaeon]